MRRRNMWALVPLVLGLALMASPAGASTLVQKMTAANQLFWQADYTGAAAAYAELETLGVHSYELLYNRATAEARQGRLGVAVQYYEKALRIAPGEADTHHNLQVIRDYIARRASEKGRDAVLAPSVGPVRALLDRFSPNGVAWAFLFFLTAAFGAFVARGFVRVDFARMVLGVVGGVLLAGAVFAGAVTAGKWHVHTQQVEAVAIAPDVLGVHEGPSDTPVRFYLEEGSRVRVLEQRDKWLRIRDDQGRDGWVPRAGAGQI
ncbi:MAG: SH3 domain-containing protein [Proteobacteria bacterium]|nr:SH3 domain-containing protein [Pseudomonadota bacterium]